MHQNAPPPSSSPDHCSFFRRLCIVTVTGWPVLVIYCLIARCPVDQPAVVTMPSWVPFLPVFTIPYLAMLFMAWLLPTAIRDGRRFRTCIRAMLAAYLLVMPWWVLTPTELPRLPLPIGLGSGAYLWLAAVDPPRNIMPCAHGIGPLIASWYVIRERPSWRWPLILALLIGLPSISLVWQHRPVDILLGALAAAAGIVIGQCLSRRDPQPAN